MNGTPHSEGSSHERSSSLCAWDQGMEHPWDSHQGPLCLSGHTSGRRCQPQTLPPQAPLFGEKGTGCRKGGKPCSGCSSGSSHGHLAQGTCPSLGLSSGDPSACPAPRYTDQVSRGLNRAQAAAKRAGAWHRRVPIVTQFKRADNALPWAVFSFLHFRSAQQRVGE